MFFCGANWQRDSAEFSLGLKVSREAGDPIPLSLSSLGGGGAHRSRETALGWAMKGWTGDFTGGVKASKGGWTLKIECFRGIKERRVSIWADDQGNG